jgi:hypothetical protein
MRGVAWSGQLGIGSGAVLVDMVVPERLRSPSGLKLRVFGSTVRVDFYLGFRAAARVTYICLSKYK